jgi:1-deoxy-D-xylulose-5-phosphate reductoisomerase
MSDRLRIAVLGATGSVGRQALEVIAAFPERFDLVGVSANRSTEAMETLIRVHRPSRAVMVDHQAASDLEQRLGTSVEVDIQTGAQSLQSLAVSPDVDLVLAAIVGRAGLPPVVAAVRSGKKIALANKESLVMAGELIMREAGKYRSTILPVDSEHAAAHQLLAHVPADQVRKLILTASGGPFFGRSRKDLAQVTAKEALAHPNWEMGAKISIDSATMMNKGFEVIEARWLFDLTEERIRVLVHPQSLVHAMVETVDGSVLAQLAEPDMRVPVAYALGYPQRLDLPARLENTRTMDLCREDGLQFRSASEQDYPALEICRRALRLGGGVPAAVSVADEVLVDAFLHERIGFLDITTMLGGVIDRVPVTPIHSLQDAMQAGEIGARLATEILEQKGVP